MLDPDARVAGRDAPPEAQAAVPLRSAIDIEEYFDSAPIPPAAIEAPVSSFKSDAGKPADKPGEKS